jgi:hypothetical protein
MLTFILNVIIVNKICESTVHDKVADSIGYLYAMYRQAFEFM